MNTLLILLLLLLFNINALKKSVKMCTHKNCLNKMLDSANNCFNTANGINANMSCTQTHTLPNSH